MSLCGHYNNHGDASWAKKIFSRDDLVRHEYIQLRIAGSEHCATNSDRAICRKDTAGYREGRVEKNSQRIWPSFLLSISHYLAIEP